MIILLSKEQHGFSFSEYSEDTVKGFIIRKQFKNIDEISVNADAEYNLAELLNGKNITIIKEIIISIICLWNI